MAQPQVDEACPARDTSLSALVKLIADATKVVEASYQDSYVPSLDDTGPHPLDDKVSPPDVRKAVQTIEAACAQLCATVTKPKLAIVNVSNSSAQAIAEAHQSPRTARV